MLRHNNTETKIQKAGSNETADHTNAFFTAQDVVDNGGDVAGAEADDVHWQTTTRHSSPHRR